MVAGLVVVAAGLLARAASAGTVANVVGSALYTAMLFTLILAVRPETRAAHTGLTALGVSCAVELFQLTPYPDAWSRRSSLAHLVFGAGFEWLDLLSYVCGAAAAMAVLRLSAVAAGRGWSREAEHPRSR